MTQNRAAIAGSALSVILLAAIPARAAGPFTERRSAATIGARRGLALAPGTSATPWAYGFGARWGFTTQSGVYLGLSADSFLFDRGIEHYPGKEEVEITGYLGTALAQLGYDWGLSKWLVLRITGGLGAAWGSFRLCSERTSAAGTTQTVCEDGKNPRGAVALSLAPMVRITKRTFVMGGAQWLVDTGFEDRTTGAIFFLDLGRRF